MPRGPDTFYSVREPAWKKAGRSITAEGEEAYPGKATAMIRAGHSWDVIQREVFVFDDPARMAGLTKATEYCALQRSDNREVLSVVSTDYVPIQNVKMWDLLEMMIGEGPVKIETAGTFDGGRRLWAMARLEEPVLIPGDISYLMPYIFTATSHDTSRRLSAGATNVRIICANTFLMALNQSSAVGAQFSFMHRGDPEIRIEEVRNALSGVRVSFAEFTRIAKMLSEIRVSRSQTSQFIQQMFPKPEGEEATERAKEAVMRKRAGLLELLQSETNAPVQDTAWGLFNAGIEWADYARPFRSEERHFSRMVEPSRTKSKILSLVQEVAA